jgi:hypothetical protein
MNAIQKFRLGTAIKITTVLSLNSPSAVNITIKDNGGVIKANAVSMTSETLNIYSYIYQSAESDDDGKYEITIKATYGAYTALSKDFFELID